MYSLEIRDLDCFTNTEEVEETMKRYCPNVSIFEVVVTSVNYRGQNWQLSLSLKRERANYSIAGK